MHPGIALWQSNGRKKDPGPERFLSGQEALSNISSGSLLQTAKVGSIGSLHAHAVLLSDWLAANEQVFSTGDADTERSTALTTLAAKLQQKSVPANASASYSIANAKTKLEPGNPLQRPLLVALEADAVLHDDFVQRMQTLLQQVQAEHFDGVNLWMQKWFCNSRKVAQYGPAKLVWPTWSFQKGVQILAPWHGIQ